MPKERLLLSLSKTAFLNPTVDSEELILRESLTDFS